MNSGRWAQIATTSGHLIFPQQVEIIGLNLFPLKSGVMAKSKKAVVISDEIVMTKILLIRKKKVMIDRDLAELYGVTTKRLNEQVKRNIKRFPLEFMFQLTVKEKEEV